MKSRTFNFSYPVSALVISENRTKSPYPVPPVGAAMVAEALSSKGFNVSFLDLCFERSPLGRVRRECEKRPDLVVISLRNLDNIDSRNPQSGLEFLEKLSSVILHRNLPLIIGGSGAAIAPAALLEFTGCRSVYAGSAESFSETLLKTGIPGGVVISEEGGHLCYDGLGRWIDFTPYLGYENYVPVRLKQGCRFSCSYCPYPVIEGKRIVTESGPGPERFIREWIEKGVSIDIVDALFNDPPEWAVSKCRDFFRSGIIGDFHISSLSPRSVSAELLDSMVKIGVSSAVIGVDSASDRMLFSYNKPFRMADITRLVTLRQGTDLRFLWSFVVGGPGETEETLDETMSFVESLPASDVAYITPGVRIYPGTLIERQAVEENRIARGENLLEPRFYFSGLIEKTRMMERLERWESSSDNVVISSRLNGRLARFGVRATKIFRGNSPAWMSLPVMKRWLRRLGLT